MKIVIRIVITILIMVAGIRYMERKSLFFPMRQMSLTPAEINLRYQEVNFLTSDNVQLNAWFIPAPRARYTVLFSHGNAGNISHRLDKISIFNDLGFNVFLYDYRGYGRSQGSPSETGLYRDAEAAYQFLVRDKRISPENIILYGESLGGPVSVELASGVEFGALLTEASFTSIKDMARIAFPILPHFILASRFDSLSKMHQIDQPKLIIHSVDDEIVPFSQGERLFAAAREPKEFLRLRGGHNTAFLDSRNEYIRGIRQFVDGL